MESFCGTLCERPLPKAPIKLILSPRIVTSQSEKPSWMSHKIANSRATASAGPISLPQPFHPETKRHAAHLQPKMMPTPQEVEASTHREGSTARQGSSDRDADGLLKKADHQVRLSCTDF